MFSNSKIEFRTLSSWLVVAFGLLLLALTPVLAPAAPDAEVDYIDADLIRVGISDDDMTAWEYPLTRITGTGHFRVIDSSSGQLLLTGLPGEELTITVDKYAFSLRSNFRKPAVKAALTAPDPDAFAFPPAMISNAAVRAAGPLRIEPVKPVSRLKITNITRRKEIPSFRGGFEIVRGSSSPNKLSVVNVVSLEDYLKAVVPNELPMRYGLEAVRAQAVAARNYAIRPREKPWKTFDICDSQLCQVYLGSQTETADSNRAIADTEGLVGLFDGEPILALFSSSHGGYAENYSNAFSDPKTKQYPAPFIPYLKGGPDVPVSGLDLTTEEGARRFWTDPNRKSFDVDSPHYYWDKRWTRAELEAALNKGLLEVSKDTSTRDFVSPLFQPGDTIGTFRDVRVLQRGTSGKAMVVAIEGSRGTWTVKKEFLIRKVFNHGGRMLPSANVVFTPQRNAQGAITALRAQGGGFGHGVGMSQLGASWMHKHGYKFPQIVQHYYRGASLGSIPVSVGETAPARPVLTRFDVQRPEGMLWVQEGENGRPSANNGQPVRLKINGQELTVAPSGYRSGIEVDQYLKPGALNTLMLFPDARHPQRKLKAWVELYPPKG